MYELYLDEIAARYAGLLAAGDVNSAHAIACWNELSADSVRKAAIIRDHIDVREADEPYPYPDARAMLDALTNAFADRTPWYVSRAYCDEHPIWSPEENVAFRIVHDVIGHGRSGGDFSWEGENAACAAHAPLLNASARRALFTECIAQTGYAIAAGGFAEQRIGLLDGAGLPPLTKWRTT